MSEYNGNDDNKKIWTYDKEKLQRFRNNLKKHLTNEYLTLSDRKDSLESDATQIRVEIERRDRTLFPANEHGDARKYFSPLSLTDLKDSQKSEKEKELNQKLANINKESSQIEARMSEIMDFLRDLDDLVADDHSEEKLIERGQSGIKIDGNLKTSLEQLAAYYMEKKPSLEILLEYNCRKEEWGMDASKYIITQIGDQIYRARKYYNITMALLEVSDHKEDDKPGLCLTLSYDCEKAGDIKTARIIYHYGF